jgi:hypothetical protein
VAPHTTTHTDAPLTPPALPPQVTAAACVLESYDATPAVRFLRLRVVRAAAAASARAPPRRRVAASPSFGRNRLSLTRARPHHPARQDDARFSFAPGQWLDLWPEGHALPGGYSIASTPAQFAHDGTIELAVRPRRRR